MGRPISISEVLQFLRCRRQWDIQSPYRQNLVKVGIPSAALHIGSGFHEALEANALGQDWKPALDSWYADAVEKYVTHYQTQIGLSPSPDELAAFDDAYAAVYELMTRYFLRYDEAMPLGDNYEYVAVEQTCAVPIPGTDGTFTFTLDGLARSKRDGTYWVVEHKTYSSKPDMDRLSTDHQITAYAWGVAAILGEPVVGFLYDGMSKKVPVRPALLKSGRLSEAYTETIDGISYRDAINEHGLSEADYANILQRLDMRDTLDQTPFFTRWRIPVLPSQIETFASYIGSIYNDMVNTPALYPNYRFDGCWDCGVRDLCKAIQFGEDVQWLTRTAFMQGQGSQSFQRRGGESVIVDAEHLMNVRPGSALPTVTTMSTSVA